LPERRCTGAAQPAISDQTCRTGAHPTRFKVSALIRATVTESVDHATPPPIPIATARDDPAPMRPCEHLAPGRRSRVKLGDPHISRDFLAAFTFAETGRGDIKPIETSLRSFRYLSMPLVCVIPRPVLGVATNHAATGEAWHRLSARTVTPRSVRATLSYHPHQDSGSLAHAATSARAII
jgi:hypothetical protein